MFESKELKLVSKRAIDKDEHVPEFCIYEIISAELRKKYHCKYILSQGEFSEYALEHGADRLIDGLKYSDYEGCFDHLSEAELSRKLAIAQIAVHRLENGIAQLVKTRDSIKYMMNVIDKDSEEKGERIV